MSPIPHPCTDPASEPNNTKPPSHKSSKLAPLTANNDVIAVDFTKYPTSLLRPGNDYVHPTDLGYHTLGDWWCDFVTQIPSSWLTPPIGPDPLRNVTTDLNAPL